MLLVFPEALGLGRIGDLEVLKLMGLSCCASRNSMFWEEVHLEVNISAACVYRSFRFGEKKWS